MLSVLFPFVLFSFAAFRPGGVINYFRFGGEGTQHWRGTLAGYTKAMKAMNAMNARKKTYLPNAPTKELIIVFTGQASSLE